MMRVIAAVIVTGLCASTATAGDWPDFLGPNRDATSSEKAVATDWPAGGPKALWTVDLGPGFGPAAIADGKVYILDRIDEKGDALRVLDLKTGKELWRYQYDAAGKLSYHGSRSTPVVTDEHIYTVGGFGDLHAIDRKTRKPAWSTNLGKQFTEGKLNWGYAQSPLVYKDKLIVTPTAQDTPALVALDRKTGKVVWEADAPAKSEKYNADYYASPILREVCGVTGVMQITNGEVTFVNPDNGKAIWKYDGYDIKFAIPAPTVLPSTDGGKSNRIFITGGYDDGSVMIKVTKTGSGYKIDELFRLPKDGCQLHPAIYHDGHLYANITENSKFKGKRRSEGGLACIDPNKGEVVWRTGEDPFFGRGPLMMVGDGLLLALTGDMGNARGTEGTLYLVKADPSGFKPLAHAKVLEAKGEQAWAPMALSNGLLVIRDQHQMKCLDLRDNAAE